MLHIRPWEIDLMTYEQFDRACAALDEYERLNEQVGKGVTTEP